MDVGQRIKQLRLERGLSQGDIEKKTNLLRCYVSRVENGFTVPSLETIEKLCAAMETPLYVFFYDGNGTPPRPPKNIPVTHSKSPAAQIPTEFMKILPKLSERNRAMLLRVAGTMAKKSRVKKSA
jgi:transcriptional regulator with XRE-family HTH domain